MRPLEGGGNQGIMVSQAEAGESSCRWGLQLEAHGVVSFRHWDNSQRPQLRLLTSPQPLPVAQLTHVAVTLTERTPGVMRLFVDGMKNVGDRPRTGGMLSRICLAASGAPEFQDDEAVRTLSARWTRRQA